MHDPLRLCVALAPLAIYALVLGTLNLLRRPYVITSARDTTALGMAVAGLMLVGPIELLAPETAFRNFGPFVWLMLSTLYFLLVTLVVLLQRPGLVIYNLSFDEFRTAFAQVIERLEPDPRWAGNTLAMPSLGIELHVESFSPMANIRLSSVGDHQSLSGWHRLERAMMESVGSIEVRPSPRGVLFLTLALLMFVTASVSVLNDTPAFVRSFENLLRH